MEVKTLDYNNFGVQRWIKSELELEVFWVFIVHRSKKDTGQKWVFRGQNKLNWNGNTMLSIQGIEWVYEKCPKLTV